MIAWLLAVAVVLWGAAPTTHQIRMTGGSRFLPAETIARAGDTLRFINGTGGPHNVQFDGDSIPGGSRLLLDRAMGGEKIGPLSSPLLVNEQEVYEFIVPALPPGRYPFVCLPHAAQMRGALVIRVS